MSWHDPDREDTTIYKVVVNHEEQYSISPEYKVNPPVLPASRHPGGLTLYSGDIEYCSS